VWGQFEEEGLEKGRNGEMAIVLSQLREKEA
jgi:hypothetical protein